MTATAAMVIAAEQHASAGDYPTAAALVERVLAGIDPDTAAADPLLVRAGLIFLEVADVPAQKLMGWGQYAFTAAPQLADDDLDLASTSAYSWAVLLRTVGRYDESIDVFRQLLAATARSDAPVVWYARAGLAESLHAAGRCTEAVRDIADIWQDWQACRPGEELIGTDLLGVHAAILLGCGLVDRTRSLLVHAGTLLPTVNLRDFCIGAFVTRQAANHEPACTLRPVMTGMPERPHTGCGAGRGRVVAP